MPLSKARMKARKRQDRSHVKPKSNLNDTRAVQPKQPGYDAKTFGYATRDVPEPEWMLQKRRD